MKKHFLIFTLSLLFFSLAQGKVRLPAMMGDHMVLQQNSSVKLWGWADGKKVTVTTSWNKPDLQGNTRQGRGLAGQGRHSCRELHALFHHDQ